MELKKRKHILKVLGATVWLATFHAIPVRGADYSCLTSGIYQNWNELIFKTVGKGRWHYNNKWYQTEQFEARHKYTDSIHNLKNAAHKTVYFVGLEQKGIFSKEFFDATPEYLKAAEALHSAGYDAQLITYAEWKRLSQEDTLADSGGCLVDDRKCVEDQAVMEYTTILGSNLQRKINKLDSLQNSATIFTINISSELPSACYDTFTVGARRFCYGPSCSGIGSLSRKSVLGAPWASKLVEKGVIEKKCSLRKDTDIMLSVSFINNFVSNFDCIMPPGFSNEIKGEIASYCLQAFTSIVAHGSVPPAGIANQTGNVNLDKVGNICRG